MQSIISEYLLLIILTITLPMDFRHITFGTTDAQLESAKFPKLLVDGYFNTTNIIECATDKTTFLFLGYKGSGKSALSEHLKLSEKRNLIVHQELLKDLPYKTLGKIVAGDAENEIKLKVAWRWVLLTYVLNGLNEDEEAKCTLQDELEKAIVLFTQAGIFPLVSISHLITKASTNTFKASIQAFAYEHTSSKENALVSLDFCISFIKRLITSFKEQKDHMIIIDGLDDILTTRDIQYVAIAALINEAKDLNLFFLKNNINIKIIILCRTDIFERLPDPNKNKIRQDCSFSFSWYNEGVDDQSNCDLVKLANLRTKMAYPKVNDMFKEFFPNKYDGKATPNALLEFTRHTPRDFLQLLNCIQDQCMEERVDLEAIKDGLAFYSSGYFLPEIKDEMAGYIPAECIDEIINVFAALRKREFSYEEFATLFRENQNLSDLNIDYVLKVLFDCSAIGQRYSYDGGQNKRITFKYRNRNSSIKKSDKFLLHKGLWKALNVNF